eukprot:bmy_01148T0
MPGGAEAGEAEEEAGAGSGSEAEEDALWERIEGVRHRLTRALNPAKLTPYLRQCRVIDEQDEEEVLSTYRFPCRVNRTEVRRLREARKSQLQREQQLQARGRVLEEERAGLEQRLREQQQAQERCQRLREDWEAGSLELLRLKDENYMIAMRLAQLSEEKNSAVLRSRDLQLAYLQEMEDLRLKHRTLQKDCDLYKHRMATVLAQLEEIEKERDQAIQSRDRIQLQYSQSLIEKDQYRKQVRGLEAERDELLTALTSLEGAKALLEVQLQRVQGGPYLKACASSHSLCSNLSSTWSLSEFPSPLGGPETAGEAAVTGGSEPHTSEEATDSEKEINRLSILPFPPSAGSILRRQREEDPAPPKRSFSSMSDITGSVTLKPWSPGLSSSSSSDSVWPLGKPEGLLARGCGLDLLNRYCSCLGWVELGGWFGFLEKACQSFHEALDAWVKRPGAEPFYIRANLTLPERTDPHALCVKAQEILRLVDPAYKRRQEWFCTRVDPLTLWDLDRGTVPNYQSLVRPLLVSALRPVVLLPECLAPRLIRNLLDLPSSRLDFQVCPAESLSGEEQCTSSAPGAPKARPATPGLGSRIRAIQESVGKKHCLLELGARGVRELVQNEIYPIVIHVEVTEKNVREVRGLLGRPGWRDSELLRQCRGSEQVLWGLPCSWVQVAAHEWGHSEELAKVVRGRILQEQARLVWAERGSGRGGSSSSSEA